MLMSDPQIVHVEEIVRDARVYTVSVVRVSGGLCAQWSCACGELEALPQRFLTIADAVKQATRELHAHHQAQHPADARS
jgi:hypothetical protein